MLNENEKALVEKINYAKGFVRGELEINRVNGDYYAMDYRENFGGVFPIDANVYKTPLITAKDANVMNVDVIKCCNKANVYYSE